MKHSIVAPSETEKNITVTLDADDLATAKTTALQRLSRRVKVPGFRKGKAPASVAEKHVDAVTLANEVVEHAVNTAVDSIISGEDLRVLDRPTISIKTFVPYTDMEFDVLVQVVPHITLGDYTNLGVKKTVPKVTKADVDEVLDRIMHNLADKKVVERAAQQGDEVTIDFVGTKDGVAFDGGTATDYVLTLGSHAFIPGFEEAIVGHVAHDTFDVSLTFPKEYQVEELKGQPVVFSVVLKQVTEVTVPKLDDALAAQVGPFKTVKELTDDIKRELAAQNERHADEAFKDALVRALVDASTVPIPQVLLDDQLQTIEQDARQNLAYRGVTPEQYMERMSYADENTWREREFQPAAMYRVQAGLVVAEVSKIEQIDVTRDELEARHASMVAQYPRMKQQLDAPEARRDIANRLMSEKTIARIVELNTSRNKVN